MPEPCIDCPECDTRIRFRTGIPDRDWIECPRCGEEVSLARLTRRRGGDRRAGSRRSQRSVSRRPARRSSREASGSSAGLWIGLIGGGVGILGLILGLIFYFNSGNKDRSPADETLASKDSNASGNADDSSSSPFNPLGVLNGQAANSPAGGEPTPILGPGPDGVIPAPAAPGAIKQSGDQTNKLQYGLKVGEEFAYRTTVTAQIGGETHETRGTTRYQVLRNDPAFGKLFEDEEAGEQMATGSGFVVHPDGYLMTCAHVVEGATKIQVDLGGKKYAARVIEINSQRDLALVQISARNLPVLPLGNSNQIELAQHVRLVGYPLSDVLGSSVKVTQGSVAGFIERANGRMIQVDASMNPGNSGGPLVNDRGEAIGVASAGYFGSEIAEVGLAVPVNDVAALMRKNSVSPTNPRGSAKLDGPELARKVTPSVGYFQVTMGSTASKESLVLKQVSSCSTTRRRSDGRPIYSSGTTTKTDTGKFMVNEYGEVLQAENSNATLPYGLGPISHLAIEPLSRDGETSWGAQRLTTIKQVKQSSSRYDPYAGYSRLPPSRYGRRRPLPPPRRSPFDRGPTTETTKVHLALEISEYELAASSEGSQIINKTYLFQTIDDEDQPFFRLFGTGNIHFDLTRKMPKEIHYQLQMQIRGDDGSLSLVPIEVVCERYTDEEFADFKRRLEDFSKQAEEMAKNRASATPATPAGTPAAPSVQSAESLDQQLAMLKNPSSNFSQKYLAMNAIMKIPVDEKRQKDVLDVVEPMLKDSNSSIQNTAIRLYGVWGTEDRAGVLFEMAGGFSQSLRWDAMRALGKIGGKKSAEAVAKRLPDKTDSLTAASALKEMGPVAEEYALKYIDHPEQPVRYQVYGILGEVGGAKSRAALANKSQTDPNNFNRAAAQIALRRLETR